MTPTMPLVYSRIFIIYVSFLHYLIVTFVFYYLSTINILNTFFPWMSVQLLDEMKKLLYHNISKFLYDERYVS